MSKTRAIQTAISSLKLRDQKEDMVASFTDGRTTHVSKMTLLEQEAFLIHLNSLQSPVKQDYGLLDLRRKAIISIYRQMHFEKFDERKGKLVADMHRIKADVKIRWHKDLNSYTASELSGIIGVLATKILPWWLNQKKNETRKN